MTGFTTITIPSVGTAASLLPVFVGEGQLSPAFMWNFSKTTLGPVRKILALAGCTGELENASPDVASQIIGRVSSDRVSVSMDKVVLGVQSDDGTTPQGLLNGVASLPPAASTDQLSNMVTDIGNMVHAIGLAGISPADVVFIAGPREAIQLQSRLIGSGAVTVLTTLALPIKTVVCVAPAALASGYQGPPTVETTKESTYVEADTSPPAIGTPGSPNTIGAPTRSLFQTHGIGIRVRAKAAFVAASGGVQWIQNVAWA
jgi:hypothetical protein